MISKLKSPTKYWAVVKIPGILQARTLEWVAISFSNAWKWEVKVKSFSRVRLLATPWYESKFQLQLLARGKENSFKRKVDSFSWSLKMKSVLCYLKSSENWHKYLNIEKKIHGCSFKVNFKFYMRRFLSLCN